MSAFGGMFVYGGRFVWYHTQPERNGEHVNLYFDEGLRDDEQKKLAEKYDENMELPPGRRQKALPLESLQKQASPRGTIAIITNAEQKKAEDTYLRYKKRANIEQMADILNNVIEGDATYMQDPVKADGYTFILTVALQWCYCIFNHMNKVMEAKIRRRYPVIDVIEFLEGVYLTRVDGAYQVAGITKPSKRILDAMKLSLHEPYDIT